jgi:hypothetical protein
MDNPRRLSSKAVVTLSVRENISAESVHATLDRIFEESGCTRCGLLGFDLAILTIDDDWSRQSARCSRSRGPAPSRGSRRSRSSVADQPPAQ